MSSTVGAARSAWLLTRLRVRRQFNALSAGMSRRRRKGTARGSRTAWLLNGLIGLAMLGSFAVLSHQMMRNMQTVLGSEPAVQSYQSGQASRSEQAPPAERRAVARTPRAELRPLPPEAGSMLPRGVRLGAVFAASLLLLGAFVTTVANREIIRPDWDLEWLVTLPLPRTTLLGGMLVERMVTNHFGLLTLGTFLSMLAWTCGYRWSAPLVGVGITLLLLVMVAALQILVDTGLRLSLSVPRLRNIHAVISLIAVMPLLLPMTMAMHDGAFAFDWALAMPDWVSLTPGGLAVRAIAATESGTAATWLAAMLVEVVVVTALAFAVLAWRIRGGVVAAGAQQAVTRRPRATGTTAAGAAPSGWTFLTPVQRRELRLLGRDRTFMVQTLILPVTMLAVQIVLNPNITDLSGLAGSPSLLATLAFLLSAYTLMFSAFQALNAEGQALWIMHCVPHSLESVLWQKARLWAGIAVMFPLTIFAAIVALDGELTPDVARTAAVVLIGVPIFAVIATALGVFGYDASIPDVRNRIRLAYGYLYILLGSLYGYAIFAETAVQQITMVVLTALVAAALWQKARDRLPYLLDAAAAAPARISVSDGLIAALLFYVLQAIAFLLQTAGGISPTTAIWVAFCIAGAITFGIMRLIYRWSGTAGVPRFFDAGLGRALGIGVLGGSAAALVGFAYIRIVLATGLVPESVTTEPIPTGVVAFWLGAVAVLAAPVFEEFIFRGLLFGGLRRSFGPAVAVIASAAIFAIVHPPISMVPVFCMGVVAAWIYNRTGMLAASIAAHAIYNAAVIAVQWGPRWL